MSQRKSLPFYRLCLVVVTIATTTAAAKTSSDAATTTDDVDSNQVLSDFIWENIITAPTNNKQSMSSLKSTLAKLTTTPTSSLNGASSPALSLALMAFANSQKPKNSKLSSPPKSLLRRSSFASASSSSPSPVQSRPPQSRQPFQFESMTALPSSLPAKYFPKAQATFENRVSAPSGAGALASSFFNIKAQPQLIKTSTSYSGPAHGRSFFTSAPNRAAMKAAASAPPAQTSLYDILPMPSYGFMKQQQASNQMEMMMAPRYQQQQQQQQSYYQNQNQEQQQQPQRRQQYQQMQQQQQQQMYQQQQQQQEQQYQAKRTIEIAPMINEGKGGGSGGYGQGQQSNYEQMEPQIIEVAPDDQPIQIVFRSTSTRVQVKQIHTPIKPEEPETTRTEEEPQRISHHLLRPIIQEVHEVILPYRRVIQEVRPVVEEIRTIVSKQAPQSGSQEASQPQPGPEVVQQQQQYSMSMPATSDPSYASQSQMVSVAPYG